MDIIQKWSPILDVLNVTDVKKRRFMSVYAEHQSKSEPDLLFGFSEKVDLSMSDGATQGDIAQNLLPMSMKILSLLNLEGKRIQIKENLPTRKFSIDISNVTELDKKKFDEMNLDFVRLVENKLMDILVENINEELKTKNNFYIQSKFHFNKE